MFVYLIINEVNLKMYVGKSIHPLERWDQHKNEVRGTKQSALCRAVRKYGVDKFHFVIWQEYLTEEESFEGEKYWIKTFDTTTEGYGYNMTHGGEGVKLTQEGIRRMAASMVVTFADPERRQRISEVQKKRFESEEEREKLRQGTLKYFEDPEARKRHGEIQRLCKGTPEARAAQSVAMTAYFSNPGARQACSERGKLAWTDEMKVEQSKRIAAFQASPAGREIIRRRKDNPMYNEKKAIAINLYIKGELSLENIGLIIGKSRSCVKTMLIDAGVFVFNTKRKKRNEKL